MGFHSVFLTQGAFINGDYRRAAPVVFSMGPVRKRNVACTGRYWRRVWLRLRRNERWLCGPRLFQPGGCGYLRGRGLLPRRWRLRCSGLAAGARQRAWHTVAPLGQQGRLNGRQLVGRVFRRVPGGMHNGDTVINPLVLTDQLPVFIPPLADFHPWNKGGYLRGHTKTGQSAQANPGPFHHQIDMVILIAVTRVKYLKLTAFSNQFILSHNSHSNREKFP